MSGWTCGPYMRGEAYQENVVVLGIIVAIRLVSWEYLREIPTPFFEHFAD